MATYYCGPGGSDAANGLSYANRKLTLTGCEDIPVAGGDIVHVAPGVYRESLTVDVSGTAGNPIEYRADTSGALTDGIGGIVRITGSDNDTTTARANCITATSKNYRTFTGFVFDTTSSHLITMITACSNWIIQDCYFAGLTAGVNGVNMAGTGTNNTIRRCMFVGCKNMAIAITHSATVDTSGHLVENCTFNSCVGSSVRITRVGGITIRNCTLFGGSSGIRVDTALAIGQTTTVNNCIIAFQSLNGLQAVTAPGTNEEITENYNNFYGTISDRTNVTAGANDTAFPPLLNQPLLISGFILPQVPLLGLSEWSALRAITGTGTATDDLNGVTRPATAAKLSWGAIQHTPLSREVTTVRTGAASLKLADAGVHQITVQTTAVSTIFSVYVQWEADYTGTKPQMVIKQPGQADVTVTATGASGSWELLTTTLTPAALPGYCIVELRSNNTAAATSFDVFFDDLLIRAA